MAAVGTWVARSPRLPWCWRWRLLHSLVSVGSALGAQLFSRSVRAKTACGAPTGSGSAGLQGRPAPCSLQVPVEPELLVQGPCSEQQQLVLPGFLLHGERPAHCFPVIVFQEVR